MNSGKLTTRLNKYLALHRGISRREADDLISGGEVEVNGAVAKLGTHVSEGDSVTVGGALVSTKTAHRYLLFNKPANFVCSRKKQGQADTIYTLLPPELHALKPVGRLDKDSSGLLLLTNDGDFAHSMTHPSFRKTKTYLVDLDSSLQPLHQQMISDFGVMLEDGKSQFIIEKLEPTSAEPMSAVPTEHSSKKDDPDFHYQITMSEGRNRQIRRTFAALGYTVTALHRTNFGPYSLSNMLPGEYRDIKTE